MKWSGRSTLQTSSTGSHLFNRTMLCGNVTGLLCTLNRIAIRIFLVRRAIVMAVFLNFAFSLGFGFLLSPCHNSEDAARSGELPGLRI